MLASSGVRLSCDVLPETQRENGSQALNLLVTRQWKGACAELAVLDQIKANKLTILIMFASSVLRVGIKFTSDLVEEF